MAPRVTMIGFSFCWAKPRGVCQGILGNHRKKMRKRFDNNVYQFARLIVLYFRNNCIAARYIGLLIIGKNKHFF